MDSDITPILTDGDTWFPANALYLLHVTPSGMEKLNADTKPKHLIESIDTISP